jgi:hypothetical protein
MGPDTTAVVAIVMGSLMFLIPIAGFTARFALKSVSNIKDEVARLVDELEFQRKLAAPTSRTGAE